MGALMRKNKYQCTLDTSFEQVIDACQNVKRNGQDGTWITSSLKSTFIDLHHQGHAHSIEVWDSDELIGGVYGLAIGKIFFGESMFSKKTNASKLGFINLVKFLKEKGFELFDCQQETEHLKSLGAELISKEKFMIALRNNIFASCNKFSWKLD